MCHSFFKAIVKRETDILKGEKKTEKQDKDEMKKRRLSSNR